MRRVHLSRALAGVVATLLGSAVLLLGGSPASAADVPYTDPNVSGAMGFCDANGHEITGGKLDATPFVAFAVGNYRPPAPYDQPGTGTWLLAYQPRKGIDPGNWSGEQLTASSTYTKPEFPKIEMLAEDVTMKQIVEDYPPQWDGLLQLRMYVKVANEPAYSTHYPAADIRISGDSWKLVKGGGVTCTGSGTATSRARLFIPNQLASSPAPSGATSASSSPSVAGSTPAEGGTDDPQTRASLHSEASSSTRNAWLIAVAVVALGGVIWGGVVGLRKRDEFQSR